MVRGVEPGGPPEPVHTHLSDPRILDGPSRGNNATDPHLADCLASPIDAGYADRLLLGGDTTSAHARASTGEGPGMPYLLTHLRPRLTRYFGADVVEVIFRTNPARAFAAE